MAATKEAFLEDMKEVYTLMSKQSEAAAGLLTYEKPEERTYLETFLKENNVRVCDESLYALAVQITSTAKTPLTKFLDVEGTNEEEKEDIIEAAYKYTAEHYHKRSEELLAEIQTKELLTPFYREVLTSAHAIGLLFNKWHVKRVRHIAYTLNKELKKEHGDAEQVLNYLRENNLMDSGHGGIEADRMYTTLTKKEGGGYEVKTYGDVFSEVQEIIKELEAFKKRLQTLQDDVYGLEDAYQTYIQALINAFSETDREKTIKKWYAVDIAWMNVTAPIQIVHPLEYYDDHYRKTVEADWEIRFINPDYEKNVRSKNIEAMYKELFTEIDTENKYGNVQAMCLANINRTQLYIGKPIFEYGSALDGTVTAQVVPNDMEASKEKGKKIFAFPDKGLEGSRNRPFMKLPMMIFEKEYVQASRKFLHTETEKWHQLYDIETIGHEYGHILWLDNDTETEMNGTGNFKNIEEFKATTGGIISFLKREEQGLRKEFLKGLVGRGIGLMGWMKAGQTEPYYCEGLIHLKALFECDIITWNEPGEKIKVDLSDEAFERMKAWYTNTYKKLATHYLEKKDATEFLKQYAQREGDYYLPIDPHIKTFVEYFYDLYEKHGNKIDTEDKKEHYIEN